ncbi:RNA-binding transcriptional accessory protein [Thalassotalea euphylliae]|uniref:RNA-binding transcriptional accessory protein n=1 Tax=Thalassotalea euphylliae TaxID=1655234 RepID=A0A3E0TLK1_9GAMM|nr:Tex family protein [Thalassotalea euphylliae]REL25150.1 RNA-binding transcriptional accessory protein [Thalassotalea euphylliae]
MSQIAQQIAQELNVNTAQITAAINLLDEGATVPFIARYRKEATHGLDDGHLRSLATRLTYLRELAERRQVVLTNIEQQGKLTQGLRQAIESADNKTRLEDLYLPYKPKRRTKGQMAIEAGLEPLADMLFGDLTTVPEQAAKDFINTDKGFSTSEDVLAGVVSIWAERSGEDAELLAKLRNHLKKQAHLVCKVVKAKQGEAAKYRDYFAHQEVLVKVPAHRMLAMLRGKNEGFLRLSIAVDPSSDSKSYCSAHDIIAQHYGLRLSNQAAAKFITALIQQVWKTKLSGQFETEFFGALREQAELASINVFASNLKDLLMAAPAGAKVTMGIDPGLRTGCKVAVIDDTGKLVQTATIYPHAPQNNWDKSMRTLVNLARQQKVELIAIGNGTGSRETDKLVAEVVAACADNKPTKVMVSEAGASVYSASELAAAEFPELDVSIRGAVSIARRLQDPLAELVKIDPKAIGVGQYQHDVSQSALTASLDDVIEDCVNAVGVDVNSASASLLSRVAGLTKTIAQNIVDYRDQHGRFSDRNQLLKVARLGPKAFEQAAGFLRIRAGDNKLDNTGVHPESYPVVAAMIAQLATQVDELIANQSLLAQVDYQTLPANMVGELTFKDIIDELNKPGRDPRPEFKVAQFKEGVESLADLTPGMVLEGVISNVANFGAFVDIGVHQDGLVHISALTNKFVSDPREIVKAGDVVKVKVLECDVERKRINLTMRLDDDVNTAGGAKPTKQQNHQQGNGKPVQKSYAGKHNAGKHNAGKHKPRKDKAPTNAAMGNAFADAFAKLKK